MWANRQAIRFLVPTWLSLLLCGCGLFSSNNNDPALPPGDNIVSHLQSRAVCQPGGAANDPCSGLQQAAYIPSPNEQLVGLLSKITRLEEDCKALNAHKEMLGNELESKEKALSAAIQEVKETTAQVVRIRLELQMSNKEMNDLRDKMGVMDKQHRATLEAVIRTLEPILQEQDKSAPKGPDLNTMDLLPAPKHQ
jgi:hypothetical protein